MLKVDRLPKIVFNSESRARGAGLHSEALMMMMAFITFNSSLALLIEGLCNSNPWAFEFSGFRRNRTDDLGMSIPSK